MNSYKEQIAYISTKANEYEEYAMLCAQGNAIVHASGCRCRIMEMGGAKWFTNAQVCKL